MAITFSIEIYFLLFGKDWRTFYAIILNRQDRKLDISSIKRVKHDTNFWALDTGKQVKKLLVNKGLKNHDFLDYGCGYGRMALPFIDYLNDNNKYIGVDLSKVRVKLAKEYIASSTKKKKL